MLTHLSNTLYNRLFLIAPISVIQPSQYRLTYDLRYIADFFYLHLSVSFHHPHTDSFITYAK